MYELMADDRKIKVRGEPALGPLRDDFDLKTPDQKLNKYLEDARNKSLSPKPEKRRDGLMALWKA